jgi:hypothetical protein
VGEGGFGKQTTMKWNEQVMIISLSPFATSVKRRYAYPLQQMIRLIP